MKNLAYSLLALGIFVVATPLAAVPKQISLDTSAPIQIQSDNAMYDQRHAQAIHQGNVIMTQGKHVLHSDKLIAKKTEQGRLEVIHATGSPATFKGSLNDDPSPIVATAKHIYYYPDKHLLVLEGAATLDHLQDKFRGPSLRYQIDKQLVSADKQHNDRPIITIFPQQS